MNDPPPSPPLPPPPKRRRRPKRLRAAQRPPLTINQILQWADTFHAKQGRWPAQEDGRIDGTLDEVWRNVDQALREGCRTLRPGSSLAQLLAEHRGKRNRKRLPPFDIEQILAWVDAYHARTGAWPSRGSGAISEAPGETWYAVHAALSDGVRGLPGGSSLPKLLSEFRGVRNLADLPLLDSEQVLAWADAFHAKHGRWPNCNDGLIEGTTGERWGTLNSLLGLGRRGLPGGSSLARLLAEHRGRTNRKQQPRLTVEKILQWADFHHARTGQWPKATDGPVVDAPGEIWARIDSALFVGNRGLPGQSTLRLLLGEQRGVRNHLRLPNLTIGQILAWADAHRARTGQWPTPFSGPIAEAPGETWTAVQVALTQGGRGLPGGTTLPRLLAEERGRRHRLQPPPLTMEQIQKWVKLHYERAGEWPTRFSGLVQDAPEENWGGIYNALRKGKRGLQSGSSLREIVQTIQAGE